MYYYCAVCKIAEWLGNGEISSAQMRFHKIAFKMHFGRISYFAQDTTSFNPQRAGTELTRLN